jgi:hypothetical protein
MEVNVSCRQALKSNMNVEPLNSTEWDDFTQRGRNGRKNVHTYVPQWSKLGPEILRDSTSIIQFYVHHVTRGIPSCAAKE